MTATFQNQTQRRRFGRGCADFSGAAPRNPNAEVSDPTKEGSLH